MTYLIAQIVLCLLLAAFIGFVIGWADLAAAPVDRLKGMLRHGGDRYKIHDPTSWPDQAKLAAQGRWKELEELHDILQGGREG